MKFFMGHRGSMLMLPSLHYCTSMSYMGLRGTGGPRQSLLVLPQTQLSGWVPFVPPLLEDFASSSAECPSTQESTSLVSGRVVNGDDSAALMMTMEVLWSQIGKRMQSLYFVNWIVMTMDRNMIEALSLAAW